MKVNYYEEKSRWGDNMTCARDDEKYYIRVHAYFKRDSSRYASCLLKKNDRDIYNSEFHMRLLDSPFLPLCPYFTKFAKIFVVKNIIFQVEKNLISGYFYLLIYICCYKLINCDGYNRFQRILSTYSKSWQKVERNEFFLNLYRVIHNPILYLIVILS